MASYSRHHCANSTVHITVAIQQFAMLHHTIVLDDPSMGLSTASFEWTDQNPAPLVRLWAIVAFLILLLLLLLLLILLVLLLLSVIVIAVVMLLLLVPHSSLAFRVLQCIVTKVALEWLLTTLSCPFF